MNSFQNKLKSLLLLITSLFILTSCERPLTPEEIKELKAGKTFWIWESVYGSNEIHYIEKGSGENHVLLIHGLAAHTYTWRHLLDVLPVEGYHVWALDILGFGLSDKPKGVSYGATLFMKQIHDFIRAKGISGTHIIGNSMGGGLALEMAVYHPEDIKTMTLIDAVGYPMRLPLPLEIAKIFGSVEKHFEMENKFIVKEILIQLMHDSSKITREQIIQYELPFRIPGGAEALIKTIQSFNNAELSKDDQFFPQIHIPVLLIWGAHDKWIPLCYYDHFVKDFPSQKDW